MYLHLNRPRWPDISFTLSGFSPEIFSILVLFSNFTVSDAQRQGDGGGSSSMFTLLSTNGGHVLQLQSSVFSKTTTYRDIFCLTSNENWK